MLALVGVLTCGLAHRAAADMVLVLPTGSENTAREEQAVGSVRLPTGPWAAAGFANVVPEGRIVQEAWRLRGSRASTLQLLIPLRDQITAAGYRVLYDCATDLCGGFDFRFTLSLLPEPEMHVDLGDFRYLVARRGEGATADYLALVVSRSTDTGFVHLTHVTPATAAPAPMATAAPGETAAEAPSGADGSAPANVSAPLPPAPGTVTMADLEQKGSVVLEDLDFGSGATTLADHAYPSLAALAAYLAAHPASQVTLVGHTDTTGSLATNVALSQKRAQSVRARLLTLPGVTAAQVSAEGAGWLAPRASNETEEGRARNRRVEAVLIPQP
ncbi:OmpA family protein [Phaeovulum sp. W22_SRMD_FR3]|uniref:OmpA family protein n=1 Tax=Phaeovulum sp. W22_SRMD_FR3 TaxID=3240274 RepID=UPI003F94CD61